VPAAKPSFLRSHLASNSEVEAGLVMLICVFDLLFNSGRKWFHRLPLAAFSVELGDWGAHGTSRPAHRFAPVEARDKGRPVGQPFFRSAPVFGDPGRSSESSLRCAGRRNRNTTRWQVRIDDPNGRGGAIVGRGRSYSVMMSGLPEAGRPRQGLQRKTAQPTIPPGPELRLDGAQHVGLIRAGNPERGFAISSRSRSAGVFGGRQQGVAMVRVTPAQCACRGRREGPRCRASSADPFQACDSYAVKEPLFCRMAWAPGTLAIPIRIL